MKVVVTETEVDIESEINREIKKRTCREIMNVGENKRKREKK